MTNFNIVRQTIAIATIAAAGGALISAPAFAETVSTTKEVSFAGLDLSTPAGQARMQTRIRAAARQVCGYDGGARDIGVITSQNACIAQATNGAQVQLAAKIDKASNQRVAVSESRDRNVPGSAR